MYPRIVSRPGKAAAIVFVVCALGLAWEFRRPWFQGNLAMVDPGQVIRSAQPTSQLPRLGRRYNLKSILNLRGEVPRIGGTWRKCEQPETGIWPFTIFR